MSRRDSDFSRAHSATAEDSYACEPRRLESANLDVRQVAQLRNMTKESTHGLEATQPPRFPEAECRAGRSPCHRRQPGERPDSNSERDTSRRSAPRVAGFGRRLR